MCKTSYVNITAHNFHVQPRQEIESVKLIALHV